MSRPLRYSAGYLVGWLLLATAGLRVLIFYGDKPALTTCRRADRRLRVCCTPSNRSSPRALRWFRFVYFPVQTGLVLALTNLRPYLDVTCQLYIALGVQALHAFGRRAAVAWLILFSILLTLTEVIGVGWGEGVALSLTMLGGAFFLISYDLLYDRMRADQAESRGLLSELQEAHRDLQAYAGQVEALTAARRAQSAGARVTRLGQPDNLQRHPHRAGRPPAAGSRPGARA